tara:strand:- start:1665 stop:2261 length:597 start_codon:yes stop_codon:yes gene_type:complete
MSKRYNKIPKYLSPGETKRFLDVAYFFNETKNAFKSSNMLLCIKFQLYAGLRVQEALNITPGNITIEPTLNELKVIDGKGKKDRVVPIAAPLLEDIRFVNNYLSIPKHKPYVKIISRKTVGEWYKKIAAKANVEINGTHTLRHTFARNCLRNGVPINVLQNLLGHTDLRSTLVYLKINPSSEELNKAMNLVQQEIKGY